MYVRNVQIIFINIIYFDYLGYWQFFQNMILYCNSKTIVRKMRTMEVRYEFNISYGRF